MTGVPVPTARRLRSAALLAAGALVAACGGGGGGTAPASDPHQLPPARRVVHGLVAKGPLHGAIVRLYALDGRGEPASDEPLAQTATAEDGSWSADLPADSGAILVESSGGSYIDESDPEPDPARRRRIELGDGEGFEAVLPPDAQSVALTAYSNALLLKTRRETLGLEFLAVYANNRAHATDAYGFDPVTTLPADPIAPPADASLESRSYALALGGAAQALDAIAIALGEAVPTYAMLAALIDDLSDCELDGVSAGVALTVTLGDEALPLPATDLALEILRFRNNNYDEYADTPLLVPDAATCARSGAVPDTIAPELIDLPADFTVAALDAHGTPASDPAIATVLARVSARDDRPDEAQLDSDAPETFPLGITRVTFTATDDAGNRAQASVAVTVVDLTAPVIVAPPDVYAVQSGTLTPVALGEPSVSDNVSMVAALAVTNDAPDAFPVGETRVTWSVRDEAGLESIAVQRVIVLTASEDSDGDGLSDADEAVAGSDPARVDTDGDGVGDGLEVHTGSDPTRPSAHVYYVSPDGDDSAQGDSWTRAKADNAGLGTVAAGASAAQPTFVLYADNAAVPAPGAAWSLSLSPPCDHIVLVGSLGPDRLEPALGAAGAPQTNFALDGSAGVAIYGCTNVQLHAIAISGSSASGLLATDASLQLDRVHLRENASSGDGGGLAAVDSNVTIGASFVGGNRSDGSGGGVSAHGGSLVIEHSVIAGNIATLRGGGVALAGTAAGTRIFDTLLDANGAAESGGISVSEAAAASFTNLTVTWNEASIAEEGAGLAIDDSSHDVVLVDSVFEGNRAAGGTVDSVAGLDASMSSFNLLEEAPIGPEDIDISATGAGLVAGYHLDQQDSVAVDTGSRDAADAGLDARYTDPAMDAPLTDGGAVDRGYHYADAYVRFDEFEINLPPAGYFEAGAHLRVTPTHAGAPLGGGHRVVATLGRAVVTLVSSVDVDPLGNGLSALLRDLGDGTYTLDLGEAIAAGQTTLTLLIDEIASAHTLTVRVQGCETRPDQCPHDGDGD